MDYITLPLSVFLIFVAPLWLILHYRSQKELSKGLSVREMDQLQVLLARAEQLQKRVVSLEKILDVEAPQWRQK
ncbi:envelope stress response membrane protein PspB [Psychromonas antarctica]|jgi:phage shock protein B|uniref:envelope stress response membrane protein PspB n=1 Tax=Psychromonas antarctica TaxID=67573 RepID=UPI001EE81C65|nr:envelope stress response membrane protein PspB [Psychromonas antarctica]MCG6201523.1 envelope stress response membrane protein PspB [Psychromonas antarctica]